MQEILPERLWVGHAGDLLKPTELERLGVRAVVQVALAEPLPTLSRELLIAHVPLTDGAGSPREMVAAAVELTASLMRSEVPTLVCCSAGMSRSPAIAAAAIALATGAELQTSLAQVIAGHPCDLSPWLWDAVCEYVEARH